MADKFNDNQIIRANYIKIKQLITIFIDNAIKYSTENSGVDIISSKNKLTIHDTGIGIEKSKLEQIFEKYYQIKNDNKGYGLGLCIAKYITNAHNIR